MKKLLVFGLILGKMDPIPVAGMNLNAGSFALIVNMIVYVLVSLVTSSDRPEAEEA